MSIHYVGDQNPTVICKVGDYIKISLYQNSSTGMSWVTEDNKPVRELDIWYIRFVSEEFSSEKSKIIPGKGGRVTYTFRVLSICHISVTLIYRQPWNPKETDNKIVMTIYVE